MSDLDRWRQRALRLESLLDAWGIFPQPVVEMSANDIMQTIYQRVGGAAPLPPAEPTQPEAASAVNDVEDW